jgi:hypothetical protein
MPCLDVEDGGVVKGIKSIELRDARGQLEAAQAYYLEGQMSWFSWFHQNRVMICLAGNHLEL